LDGSSPASDREHLDRILIINQRHAAPVQAQYEVTRTTTARPEPCDKPLGDARSQNTAKPTPAASAASTGSAISCTNISCWHDLNRVSGTHTRTAGDEVARLRQTADRRAT
jgi:hypothetical protein